ncbi:hypothetical protein GCM10009007_14780 [Formosimonas limnophila]|uniref:Uncharacterized protein n=1 Tax=Formosimonas limnophila TaxID=1384487 RepID=A0A8J3CNA1_9BURK|nr:hypothetical protein GCM10009007_14780 [Formosimonas limnophila]
MTKVNAVKVADGDGTRDTCMVWSEAANEWHTNDWLMRVRNYNAWDWRGEYLMCFARIGSLDRMSHFKIKHFYWREGN